MTRQETRYASQLIHELAIAREQVIALTDENRRLRAALARAPRISIWRRCIEEQKQRKVG
jgi:transcriptional/translational regulatory protein YebC/TACO1